VVEGAPFLDNLAQIKDLSAKARILTRVRRLEMGNRGDFKHLDAGMYELRMDVGQGWRVYYQQVDNECVLLMIVGAKPNQQKDIEKLKGWLKDGTDRQQ